MILVAGAGTIALLLQRRRPLRASFALGATVALVAVTVIASVDAGGSRTTPSSADASPAVTSSPQQRVPRPLATTDATWRPLVLRNGIDYARISRMRIPVFPEALRGAVLRRKDRMPAHGLVGSVRIPGVRSHWAARAAVVYLPPAALVPQPRLLPVVVMFSGQSRGAGPYDAVWDGDLGPMMDAIAARHHGIAPIVVVPDQLSTLR